MRWRRRSPNIEFLSWGSEFVDDVIATVVRESERTFEPWELQDWGEEPALLTVSFLAHFLDPSWRAHVRIVDADKMQELSQDLVSSGLREPLLMVYDTKGNVRLHDGSHRLEAFLQLQTRSALPTLIQPAQGPIRGFSRRLVTIDSLNHATASLIHTLGTLETPQ